MQRYVFFINPLKDCLWEKDVKFVIYLFMRKRLVILEFDCPDFHFL